MSVSDAELEVLAPHCPCAVCKRTTWYDYIVGFFTDQNCRACHGCLRAGVPLAAEEYVVAAQEAMAAAR